MFGQIYLKKEMCTGCSACYAACPKKCIEMIPDKHGFLYPVVDESNCIKCGKCQRVCQTYCTEEKKKLSNLYGYVNPNKEILSASSSGGIFSAVFEKIISGGGYVCGAVFDKELSVHHVVTNITEIAEKMRGSKYVQSRVENCYAEILKILTEGKEVLFTGTPCQVLGLKCFLGKDYPNLFTADCICHSVPSPVIFQSYLEMLKRKYGDIYEFSFRDKTNGWENYNLSFETKKGKIYFCHKGNPYMEGFLDGLYHRESCTQCPVKTRVNYCSDLTMGDFWQVKDIAPELYDPRGVSAVLVNTEKGGKLLDEIQLKRCEITPFLQANYRYSQCVKNGEKADLFWEMFEKKSIGYAYKKIYKIPFKIRVKTKIKSLLGRWQK